LALAAPGELGQQIPETEQKEQAVLIQFFLLIPLMVVVGVVLVALLIQVE
jgi:predicted nucleic acid-binding Zn ribbon protein